MKITKEELLKRYDNILKELKVIEWKFKNKDIVLHLLNNIKEEIMILQDELM